MNTRRVPTCFESMQSLGFVFRVADRLGVRKSPISPLLLRHRGYVDSTVDPALIFSMERTFLSAFNQAFYLMFLGSGLNMAINVLPTLEWGACAVTRL
jgi:hypothetical protein